MGIIDFGRICIPFHFNGCVVTLKVTKFSTCDDVIHMILHKMNLPISKLTLYAVFERTSSVECVLPGKSLVYKVYRSWGCEKINFQFHIKRKSAEALCLRIKTTLGNPSAEGEIDGLFMDHYTRKTEHARPTELEQRRTESIVCHTEPTWYNHSERTHAPLGNAENCLNKHENSASGKQIVLARFMYDIASRSNKKLWNKKQLSAREHGDGKDCDDLCCRQGDGSESEHIYISQNKIRSQHDGCLSFLEKTYIIESESNSDYDDVCFHDDVSSSLDTAFIKTSGGSDSDEGIDVTSVDSDFDLDVAFNEEFHITNSRENYPNSKLQYQSAHSHVLQNNTLEKNLRAAKLVKELFGRDLDMSEDQAMDSFMRSRVDSF